IENACLGCVQEFGRIGVPRSLVKAAQIIHWRHIPAGNDNDKAESAGQVVNDGSGGHLPWWIEWVATVTNRQVDNRGALVSTPTNRLRQVLFPQLLVRELVLTVQDSRRSDLADRA